MGCFQPKGMNKIVAMQTTNRDYIFTSTADIHKIFSFGKVLGIGAFGKVLTARRRNNNDKQFAIKMIDKKTVKGREAMLANEIYVLQRLDHPNIIKFHEVYQSELYFYICMDKCGGGELMESIPKNQKFYTECQARAIMVKIFSALAYIHDQGIIHRDIKPENILFSECDINSEPKLIDFGLSVKYDAFSYNKLNAGVGTPVYLAPEVIDGTYNEKCDVWSLGVLLFNMLVGYPPFYGKNRQDLYDNIRSQNLIFDKRHWRNISDEVKDLIKRMLNKNQLQRASSKECLQHPWFQLPFNEGILRPSRRSTGFSNTASEDDQRTLYQMLKTYRLGAKFKREVMKVLVNQMNEKDLAKLQFIFKKIDLNNSGTITIQELHHALQQEGSQATLEEIEEIMEKIGYDIDDIDDITLSNSHRSNQKPATIKYSNFLTACIDERRVFTREKLWSIFKYFDTRNENHLSREAIRESFARHGRSVPNEKIDQMIAEIDPLNENRIHFDAFCQMMGLAGIQQTLEFKDELKDPQSIAPSIY
ncbi:unnamed protein product [Paramecium primaurelia]|uniref:Protein kinase domain containing protein n=1 Tax=Paramecium primaurelia TaxID=5886 RepID=A0A8S1KDC9_PARPR|nr:unnamed protein product [Paramecium primaurelia]